MVSGKPWRVSVRENLRDAMNKMMRLPLKLWARDRNPTTIAKYEQIPPMGNLSSGNEDKHVRRLHLAFAIIDCRASNKAYNQRRDTETFSRSSILHDSALLNAVGTNSEAFSHQISSSEQEIDLAESDFDSESSKRSSMSFYFRPTLESYAYTHRNSLRAAANDSHIDNLYDDLESKDNEDSDAFENSA